MLRNIIIYVAIICFAISCKQSECCDIGIAGATPWPLSVNTTTVSSTNNFSNSTESNSFVYEANTNKFDSSIEEMQPALKNDVTVVENTFVENNDFVYSNEVVKGNIENTVDSDFDTNTNTDTINDATSLLLTIESPAKVYIGNEFNYSIKLKNESEKPISNIKIKHSIPNILEYTSSNVIPQKTNEVLEWQVAEISPFAIRTFSVTAKGVNNGMAKLVADLGSENNKSATGYVLIDASTGININHSDVNDPVEVGDTTTYEIEIENQGNKTATGIKVVDVIPFETSFVEAHVTYTKNISYKFEDGKVVFDTIESLAPQQKVFFQVIVKVEEVGDLLNSVEVVTDDFAKTITSQEGTKSFQE